MFKEMRRKDKQLPMEESVDILKNAEFGFLSTICENGYAYGVPLNYVYFNDSIYFHCANEGQKIENIKCCDKVSFCVTYDVELVPNDFDTKYKSVVIFGRASEVIEQEKSEALFELIKKYSNEFIDEGRKYIKNFENATRVFKIRIEHLTGKAQK